MVKFGVAWGGGLSPTVRTLALIFLLAKNLRTLALKSPACARGSRKPCTLTLEHPNLLKSYPNPCTLALKRPNLLKSYPNPCTLGQNLCTLALKSPAYPTLPCLRPRVHGFYPALPFFTLLKAESTWFLPHLTLLYLALPRFRPRVHGFYYIQAPPK